ncbi:MAG: heavy-metal-associated domain-containing protein [Deinococcus sp.]|nr:heavy-metal-associated domain-containing protein [Deinococcus sp.]
MQKLTLQVTGMTCGHCQATVEKALKKIAGVRRAQVSLGQSQALIEFDPARASVAQLVAAVEAAGYQAQAL